MAGRYYERARHRLSEWLYGLAERLEARAYSIREMASRVRPRQPMVHGRVSELIAAALRDRSHKLVNDVTKSNAILRHLRETT